MFYFVIFFSPTTHSKILKNIRMSAGVFSAGGCLSASGWRSAFGGGLFVMHNLHTMQRRYAEFD